MKKIALIIFVLLSFTPIFSQERKIIWGASSFYSNRPKQNTSLLSSEMIIGYRLSDRFTGVINLNTSSSQRIFSESHNNISTSFGVDFGYNAFNSESYFIFLRGGLNSNLLENKNKYLCYKGGAYIATGKLPIKPIFGISLHYYDFMSKEKKNLFVPCLSIGFFIYQ